MLVAGVHTGIMAQNLELYIPSEQTFMQPATMAPPAAIDDYSRPVTPEDTNGLATSASPRSPRGTGLSLTEYTANPSPPSEDQKSKAQEAIPEAFLLPNGYPDVCAMRIVLPEVEKTLRVELPVELPILTHPSGRSTCD